MSGSAMAGNKETMGSFLVSAVPDQIVLILI